MNAAADEVQLGEPGVDDRRWPRVALAALVIVVGIATIWQFWPDSAPPEAPPASSAQTSNAVGQAEDPATTPPPAVVSEPQEPRFPEVDADWLEGQDLRAWQAMASAWGRPGDGALIEASCNGRSGLGYACVRDQGTWPRIRQLNLPVVLALPGDPERHVMLGGLDGERLLVGGDGTLIRRDDIESRWFGDFLVAWPQSPDWPRQLARGDDGDAVSTIIEMAGRADVPYDGEAVFGAAFETWLTGFQRRHGLEADGIVGPKTLLYLMRFSLDEPHLETNLGDPRTSGA